MFTRPQREAEGEPETGTIVIRTEAALVRSTARQRRSATVYVKQEDGSERLHLRASGAVPSRSTHGAKARAPWLPQSALGLRDAALHVSGSVNAGGMLTPNAATHNSGARA